MEGHGEVSVFSHKAACSTYGLSLTVTLIIFLEIGRMLFCFLIHLEHLEVIWVGVEGQGCIWGGQGLNEIIIEFLEKEGVCFFNRSEV